MTDYLNGSLANMLDAVSRGPYAPGAGSVAALASATASALLIAACEANQRAQGREECNLTGAEVADILTQLREHLHTMRTAIQEDADVFGKVGTTRDARDRCQRGSDERKELHARCCSQLIEATSPIIRIIETAPLLAELGCVLYERGIWWVTGDCSVSIHLALASADGATSILRLNRFTLRNHDTQWCEHVAARIQQSESRISKLRERAVKLVNAGMPDI